MKLIQYNILLIIFNLIYSNQEPNFATKLSLFPFQKSNNYSPVIHIGSLKNSTENQTITGLQFYPTSNLILGGILSPQINNNNLSLYYQILIGYIPKWNLTNISSNIIQIGMHYYKFHEDLNYKWISISYTESIEISFVNLSISINKLITNSWERNTIQLLSKITLFKNLFCQIGAITYFTPQFNHSQFFMLSLYI